MATNEAEINLLKETTIKLFHQVFEVHQKLGDEGKKGGKFNPFGEVSLLADWEAEEVFINGCREVGVPIAISSEEHGEVIVTANPKYRGVLDGIDGTNAYKLGTGPYGTMFAILEGVNPRYQDYLVAGILEYPSGRLLLATRGRGSFLYSADSAQKVSTSGQLHLSTDQSKVYVDGGIEFSRQVLAPKFKGFRQVHVGNIGNTGATWGASSMYYFNWPQEKLMWW